MKEITLSATTDNIDRVTDFVNEQLEAADCPIKVQMQIDVAIDEIFSNIASYAYESNAGSATVQVSIEEESQTVILTFVDQGIPYNPLTNEDPDVTQSAEERKVGGLGIFLVKKIMDEVTYEYRDQENRLTLKKKLQ